MRFKRTCSAVLDAYQTPAWVLGPLVPHIYAHFRTVLDDPMPTLWDCAAGKGNLVVAAQQYGFTAFGTDILNGDSEDFLACLPSRAFDCIVTNPPFSNKEQFLERAYSLHKPFAFLLPFSSLETEARQRIFKENSVEIVFLPKRVYFETPDGNVSRARFATAWFTSGLSIGQQLNFP